MYGKKYDEIIMKLLYSKIGLKFDSVHYAKQRVFIKNLLKKYDGEDLISVINYCSDFRQKDFKNTYFLYANAERLIPIAKNWEKVKEEKQNEEQKPEKILDNTSLITDVDIDLW